MKNEQDVASALVKIAELQQQAYGNDYIEFIALTAMQKFGHWLLGNECCTERIQKMLDAIKIEAKDA